MKVYLNKTNKTNYHDNFCLTESSHWQKERKKGSLWTFPWKGKMDKWKPWDKFLASFHRARNYFSLHSSLRYSLLAVLDGIISFKSELLLGLHIILLLERLATESWLKQRAGRQPEAFFSKKPLVCFKVFQLAACWGQRQH